MGKNIEHIQHIKSNVVVEGKPKLPTSNVLVEGEIAVNYAQGYETLSIKNSSGTVVPFSSDEIILALTDEVVISNGVEPTNDNVEIWIDTSVEPEEADVYTKAQTDTLLGEKQNTLTAGSGIDITNDVISVTASSITSGEVKTMIDDKLGSGFTGENSAKTVTEAIEEDERVTSAALNDLKTNKLDLSAYTPSVELWEAGSGTNSAVLKNSSGTASGDFAVAEGRRTSATSESSHAEGGYSKANNRFSHAEGYGSTASGDWGSHAEGYYTIASGDSSHAEGNMTKASGTYGAHAEGYQTTASGESSHAEGYNTKANGNSSHAEGSSTQAIGSSSHAEGYSTSATSIGAHAEGDGTLASDWAAHAEGASTKATGRYSHAEGSSTIASGARSHSEGDVTKAIGDCSHAEGQNTTANGDNSHAEGGGTTTNGRFSHAEGYYTTASGDWGSHAEGSNTIASGMYSHAEGYQTSATTQYSHTEGLSTIANNKSEHASGQFNVSSSGSSTFGDSGNTLFSVGNGTAKNARHNAFEIRQNGDIYIVRGGNTVLLQDEIGNIVIDQAIDSGTSASTNAVSTSAVYGFVTSYTPSITVDQVLNDTTSASTNPVSSKAVYDAVTDNELVWTNAYVTISGAISSHTEDTTVHFTTGTVQTQINNSVTGYADSVKYNSTSKYVEFYHGTTGGTKVFEFDASPFIIDGMVQNVEIKDVTSSGTCLVISFNTDAGKQDINIPISDIFDASNYYNKTAIDTLVGSGFTSSSITDVIIENEQIVSTSLNDLKANKLDASAYTPTDLSNYYTKDETSGKTEISNALGTKVNSATFTAHTADSTVHLTSTEKTNIDALATNIAAISGITSASASSWNAAASSTHNHSNKATLDAITATSAAINSLTGAVGTMAFQNASSYSSATQVNTALNGKSDTSHTHASSAITSMAGYTMAASGVAITTADTLNQAIGKLEKQNDEIVDFLEEKELAISAALTDLEDKIGDIESILATI